MPPKIAATLHSHICDKLKLQTYSRGMGAIGLPGDLSSQSRFVRAAFVKMNAVSAGGEMADVIQSFYFGMLRPQPLSMRPCALSGA